MYLTARNMDFSLSEFLAGTAFGELTRAGIRYFQSKTENKLDIAASVRDIAQCHHIMQEVIRQTLFDRFIIFEAEDSAGKIVAGKRVLVTSIYEEYDPESNIPRVEIDRWQSDGYYYDVFADMLTKGTKTILFDEMPESKLKNIYMTQGVKISHVCHLATTDNSAKVFYCSVSSTVRDFSDSNDMAMMESGVDRLKAIFEKYKNFHIKK